MCVCSIMLSDVAECYVKCQLFQTSEKFPKRKFQSFKGTWDHRLADLRCWNIVILVDLAVIAEVVPIIIYPSRNVGAVWCQIPYLRSTWHTLITNIMKFHCTTTNTIRIASFESSSLGKGGMTLWQMIKLGAWGKKGRKPLCFVFGIRKSKMGPRAWRAFGISPRLAIYDRRWCIRCTDPHFIK